MKYIVLLWIAVGSTLFAQTASMQNTSNAALGMDFVSGDAFLVSITGAAPNKPVTVTLTRNGVLESDQWHAGDTDGNGEFVWIGTENDDFIAEFTEQYYVDGNEVGDLFDFEVIYKPSSVGVAAVGVAALPSGCTGTYGIMVDITYQMKNPNGESVTTLTGMLMTPKEELGNPIWHDGPIGPVAGYPTSSLYAASNGTFHDVPLGACGVYLFSNYHTDNQTFYISIGNNDYYVRENQVFTVSGPTPGHGSISNGSDVTKSR